jgi:hypothetical protein
MLEGMTNLLPALKRRIFAPRCWMQAPDGMYYRNYALIQEELGRAMAEGHGRTADALIAEGLRVLEEGPLRKLALGRGDVLVGAPANATWPLQEPGIRIEKNRDQ